ncbi:MAG TPA: ABC transporter permease [Acidimicrobiales bacterium]|nr:ABC transporter permease [Acidimicrobiales bacterium]
MTSARATIPRPSVQIILTSLGRADFVALVKNPRRLLLSFLLPIVLLIVTNSSKATKHLGGADYIIGLAISYGLLSTSILGYALGVARDRENGVFQRLRVTPAPTWTIMASRLGMQVLANFVMALVVVVIGSQMHNVALSVSEYVLVLVISLLGGAVFLAIGQALVAFVKSADTVNAGGRILFIVLILLGLFGQSGTLGSFWESISHWSPVGAVMTLFAGVLKVSAWGTQDWLSIVACVGYIVSCAAAGIRWFRWDAK